MLCLCAGPTLLHDCILYFHRAFGASVRGKGLTSVSGSSGHALQATDMNEVDVTVTVLTLEPEEAPDAGTWLKEITKVTPAPPGEPTPPEQCGGHAAGCSTTWEEVISRSYIQVTPNGAEPDDGSASNITNHANWDRYLNVIQG